MKNSPVAGSDKPSLEALVEAGVVGLRTLHPGGLGLTAELADLCGISAGTRVLDVACGTGETGCYLTEKYGAAVTGVDRSETLLAQARDTAESRLLEVRFCSGDAESLPFPDGEFDVAVCECTLCLLDKAVALSEMVRVVGSGGRVGMHDLSWEVNATADVRRRLAEIEDERPETLEGWKELFGAAGLSRIVALDRSALKRDWMRDVRAQLGFAGQLRVGAYALRRWGLRGLWRIIQSERVFSNDQLGYALIAGRRP